MAVNKYDIWALVRPKLPQLLVAGVLGFIAGYGGSYLLTETYRASATLLPVEERTDASQLLGLAGPLSELGAFSGLGSSNQRVEALETLKSRAFAQRFIQAEQIVDALLTPSDLKDFAAWERKDLEKMKLRRATDRLIEEVADISEDKRSGVVRLSIFWKDPVKAAAWANKMADSINAIMREKATVDARLRLEHLKSEAGKTTVVGVQEAIYKVMESQIKTLAIASATEEYAYKVIDPASEPEPDDYVRPNRIAMAVGGAILFCALGVVLLAVSNVYLPRTTKGD